MEQNHPLVSISLLTYNAEKYLEDCFDSVLKQIYPHLEILIIDNHSTDRTRELLKHWRSKIKNLRIIFNQKNIGFAAGHNQGIRESRGKFILCLNQDAILDKDFIQKAVTVLEKDSQLGAVQGKLLRWKLGYSVPNEFSGYQVFPIIDSTGLAVLKNRRIIARGQGEVDQGQFEKIEEIFGVDGAVPIYRREALEDVKLPALFCSAKSRASADAQNYNRIKNSDYFGEYFDEDFFCYKEDVDLAWRMQLYGWKAIYQPAAIAWHARTAGDSAAVNFWAIIKERLKINKFAKYLSFKNQRLMQIKDEQAWLLLKHFPWFFPKEVISWCYVLLFEKYTWRAIKDLFKQMPRARQKRKIIMAKKRLGAKEMERWFQ